MSPINLSLFVFKMFRKFLVSLRKTLSFVVCHVQLVLNNRLQHKVVSNVTGHFFVPFYLPSMLHFHTMVHIT